MMSQLSGIVSKPNFFIEIHNGKVLVYLHKVYFSKDQIKMAIDVIDHLSSRLETVVSDEQEHGFNIKKEVLDKINEEMQLFIKNKETMTTTIKDTSKKLLAQLDEIQMPSLHLYLNDKYASIQNQQFQAGNKNYIVETAYQLTGFILNENGAVIESEAVAACLEAAEAALEIKHPKKMIFDKTFYIIIRRADQKNPYFVMKVENIELMSKK
jgi:hypothetical protein